MKKFILFFFLIFILRFVGIKNPGKKKEKLYLFQKRKNGKKRMNMHRVLTRNYAKVYVLKII